MIGVALYTILCVISTFMFLKDFYYHWDTEYEATVIEYKNINSTFYEEKPPENASRTEILIMKLIDIYFFEDMFWEEVKRYKIDNYKNFNATDLKKIKTYSLNQRIYQNKEKKVILNIETNDKKSYRLDYDNSFLFFVRFFSKITLNGPISIVIYLMSLILPDNITVTFVLIGSVTYQMYESLLIFLFLPVYFIF